MLLGVEQKLVFDVVRDEPAAGQQTRDAGGIDGSVVHG
jgi:hypothetical protein